MEFSGAVSSRAPRPGPVVELAQLRWAGGCVAHVTSCGDGSLSHHALCHQMFLALVMLLLGMTAGTARQLPAGRDLPSF